MKRWTPTIIYVVLTLVCVVALAAPIYNRISPRLFGLPFFIWFQMFWVLVAAVATGVALHVVGRKNT